MNESEKIEQKRIYGVRQREQSLASGKRQNEEQQPKSNSELIPVYTQWANRLLSAANSPPLTDLSGELCVPQKLIALTHSITFEFQKVPKEELFALLSDDDPLISIKRTLAYLRQIGVAEIDSIQPKDVRNGHLGVILFLLYHLSCFHSAACQHRLAQQRTAVEQQKRLAKQLQQKQRTVLIGSAPPSAPFSAHCSPLTVHRPRSNCATTTLSSQSSGYGSTCNTTASPSTTTPSSNRNNSSSTGNNRRGEKRQSETAEAGEEEKDQQTKSSNRQRRHKQQLETVHCRWAVTEALAKESAGSKMPPDSSVAPMERTEKGGESEAKRQTVSANTRLTRIAAASPHRSALRVPQISAVATKRFSIASEQPPIDAAQPKSASTNGSRLVPPAATSRRSSTTQSANNLTDGPHGRVDFAPPTLTASRICTPFSVLPTAKRHFRAPAEEINKRSSRNNEQNDEGKSGEKGTNLLVEEPILRNSSSASQRESSVPPVGLQQFELQKSVLRKPSAVKGRSKSTALRIPISNRPIDPTENEQNGATPKQYDQCPSSSSVIPHPHQQSISQTSVPSGALPPISSSSSQRNSQLRLPLLTKPTPPKRHSSTVIRTTAEGKETTEAGKEEEAEMKRLFGGRDKEKERKTEKISVPIPSIGLLSSPAADQNEEMQKQPKAEDHKQQNGGGNIGGSKKATAISKSLLLAPSSSASSRRANSATAGPIQSLGGSSGKIGTQCQRQRQQMQMSVVSNCSDCSVRSAETTAAKKGTANGQCEQKHQQQMNTSQSSSSSGGGRTKAVALVKKPCQQNPPHVMTTSSSSLSSGIKRASGTTANSDSKIASIASAKKATAQQQQLEHKEKPAKREEEERQREETPKATKEKGKCQTSNSPLMTEKKPVMAVKGISVSSGGTPPPAQKGGPSQSGGGGPLSADSDSESTKSPSNVGESRRNTHTVVGVVSPMQHQQETPLGAKARANCAEDEGEAPPKDQKQPIGGNRHKVNSLESEEEATPVAKSPDHFKIDNMMKSKTEKPSQLTALSTKESGQKVSKLAKSVPTKRMIIPTLARQKSPVGRIEEGKEREDNGKMPAAHNKSRGEECPSPSVPPPMAPTKLMSVLREEQASPCPSSSLSTPADETISRFHFDNKDLPRHHQNHSNKVPTDALIAAVAATSDASTDASRTTGRKYCANDDDQLGGLFGDCATIGGGKTTKSEEREEKGKLMPMGRQKEEKEEEEKWGARETEERRQTERRQCPMGEQTNAIQQQLADAEAARKGCENGMGGGKALRGTAASQWHQSSAQTTDPTDYASESELDSRRQPMAAHSHGMGIPGGGDKLMMALDLRGTYGAKALPAGRRKSRFRESYEDSSSLSSGLSETFGDDISTDDLTGSSSDYLLVSPDKMRQFAPENGQKHVDFVSFQKANAAHQQNNLMVNAAERERRSAGQLLQKCQSAQRGCAYFGSAAPRNGPIDPHRPSTSNGCFSSPSVGHFVPPNSAEGQRNGGGGFDQPQKQQRRHDQSQLSQPQQQLACQRHPNEQLFVLQQHQNRQQNQRHQQQQPDLFRPYHTIAAADWLPLQYQQQPKRAQRPADPRRVLSPPHNLMVLSDDGDTLSVAAGEVGGLTRTAPGAALLGTQAMAVNHFYNDSLPRRSQQHPAYHTHSLDRHAHLRVLSAGARPPPAVADDPSARQQPFTASPTAANISRNLPHQRLQLNSLLISPRHHYSVNGYSASAFGHPTDGNAIPANFHRRSRGGDIYSDCFSYADGPLLPPLRHCAPSPLPPPGSSIRSSVVSGTAAHQRSASLSAMSRSMVTVLEQHEERQRRRGRAEGGEAQQRVLDYVRALAALNGTATNHNNNNGIDIAGGDFAFDDIFSVCHKNAKRSHNQPPLPIPPRSPHLIRRAPLSLPRQLELNNNHPSAGTLSARGHADARIYSNLNCATSSGVSSPTRPSVAQPPGSQLSLASSVGSAYSTIEGRYEWEIGKLQNELEAYRTHVQLLSQKNSGYNCVIQIFDNQLQSIMTTLAKLQQKPNVKREEVEKLCNEIEQLRSLSVKAGVPYWGAEGAQGTVAKGTAKEEEEGQPQQQQSGRSSKKSWIRSSFSRAFHKGNKKSKQHQQPPKNNSDGTDNISLNSFSSCALNKSANANSSSSSVSAYTKMDTANKSQLGELSQVEMALLQRELEHRELALTDVQLDALDKAKEIDILRETVNRLQHENKLLKYNYSLLERKVRSESRASSHLSLNTTGVGVAGGGALEFDAAAMDEVLAEANEQLAPRFEFAASSPSSGDISVNTTTTGSNNSAGGPPQFHGPPAAAELTAIKSTNRCSFGSTTTTSSKRSSQGASSALPSAKVVLCVDLSGRLDSLTHAAVPLAPSQSLCPISRANSGSSSTLSSQASSSLGSVLSGAAKGSSGRRELTIGYLPLPIGTSTNWKDLDQQLGLMLEEYLHRIDPDLSLGVDSYSSIIGYQIHPTQHQSDLGRHSDIFLIRRKGCFAAETEEKQHQLGDNSAELDEVAPILSPTEALQPGTLIRLRLRGVAQHSVDALVLESLFPRHLLEQLLHQLEQHRRLLLFGPTGIGKSNLARLLAKYLLMKHERKNNNNSNNSSPNISKALVDIRFPTENNLVGGGEKEESQQTQQKVQQVKEQLVAALRPASQATVLMMDNLQWKRLGVVLEAFNGSCAAAEDALCPPAPSSAGGPLAPAAPFVICTLNRTCVDQSPVQQLQLHHNFRLFALSYKMDAVSGYLGRYIRRRLAEHQLSSSVPPLCAPLLCPSPADPVESVLQFLGRSLRAINEFIERAATGGPDLTLGPRILLQCPLNSEEAKLWFVELWNDKLFPYMRKVLAESKALSVPSVEGGESKASAHLAKDPTDEIGTLWPWASGKDELLKII